MKKALKGADMPCVSVKIVNHSGEARIVYTRPGYDGYQRMSRSISPSGRTRLMIQTGFNSENKIEHQAPGAPRNNIYDVKCPRSWGRSPTDS
jgi:hypothetical protein